MTRADMLKAAALLGQMAEELRQSHAVDGEWPAGEEATRADCEELFRLAVELRAHAETLA